MTHPDAHLWRGHGVRGAFLKRATLSTTSEAFASAPNEIRALTLWVREHMDRRTQVELWGALSRHEVPYHEWEAVQRCQNLFHEWSEHEDAERLAYELGGILSGLIKKRREWLVLSPGTDAKT